MSDVVATSQQGLTDKYHPYPEYKDSGVEWYRSIPADWGVERLKFSVRKLESGTSVNAMDTPAGLGQVGVLKTSAVYTGEFRRSENKAVLESDLARVSCPVKNGCLVVSRMNTPDLVGAAGLVTEDAESIYLPDRLWQVHVTDGAAKFIHYWTLTPEYRNQVRLVCTGTSSSMQNLSQEQFLNFLIPALGEDEKNSIAAFLDYETARIDRLIAQQQRLIELLKEKRQAVISHAVTKGLNPNAPMKDSGVEWLGQVPEHWIVKPLRHLGYCQNGINIGAEAFGSGYPFVSYGDAYKNRVLPETGSGLVQSTPEDRKRYSLLAGDVLFTRTSETIEEIGFASVCLKTIENVCFAGFLIRFRPNSNDLDANYSKYYFSNQLLRAFFIKEMNLITRASLSQDLLKTMPVVLPPRTEQKAIAEVLDEKSKRFDRLQQLGEEQIKILQERRTALISAAVTGKIDLRGWTPPAEEAAA